MLMRWLVLSFLILFFSFFSYCENIQTFTISDYLKESLSFDLELKEAELNEKKALNQYSQMADFYSSELRLGPFYDDRSVSDTTGFARPYNQWGVAGNFRQYLPTGTSLSATLSRPIRSNLSTTNNYDISLTQNLGKNFFGIQDRKISSAYEKLHEASVIKLNYQKQISCTKLSKNYIDTYLNQEQLKIHKSISDQAKELKKISDSLFNNRLIRKIEWLSSQSDAIDRDSNFEEQKENYAKSMQKLFFYSESHPKILVSPESEFKKMRTPNSDEHPLTQHYLKTSEAYEELSRYFDQQNSFDLELNYSTRWSQIGLTFGSPQLVNDQNIKLNLIIPIWSEKITSEELRAKAEADYNSLQARLRILNTKQTLDEIIRKKELYKKLSEQSSDKVKLYKTQISEAQRLYQSGKMEYDEYLRYRDKFYQESLNKLKQQANYWTAIIDEKLERGIAPSFCEG